MANRAYLFCSESDPDNPLTWVDLNTNAQRYYDSRHNIPLSWFFFFQPHQIKMIDVFSANGYLKDVDYWQEPKFMANKEEALNIFAQNEELLTKIVAMDLRTIFPNEFDDFPFSLKRLPGGCLCMDPGEVAQGDEEDFLPLQEILELIADKNRLVEVLRNKLSRFSKLNYKDVHEANLNIKGYTYGQW